MRKSVTADQSVFDHHPMDDGCVGGRRRSRQATAVASRLTSTLVTTGAHHGGRPFRIASLSMKMP
jgi:hypothetical protein